MSGLYRSKRRVIPCLAIGAVLLGGLSLRLLSASSEQACTRDGVRPEKREVSKMPWVSAEPTDVPS